jgi:hypothetical protein
VTGFALVLTWLSSVSQLNTDILLRIRPYREAVKYGHESRGTLNEELLCLRGPAETYPTYRIKSQPLRSSS